MRLDIPGETWDVPLSFEFPGIDAAGVGGRYRAVLWVNGFRECCPPFFSPALLHVADVSAGCRDTDARRPETLPDVSIGCLPHLTSQPGEIDRAYSLRCYPTETC
jgi:hypothetical protein